ncbi:MAG: hypothetical protein ABS33_05225 [Verrucomicrobia subdivision 6 bacterium BACL9 MAG-120924-bin69]|uniref:Uncharacterized protein n=1 Tax=Verrucomicrobia subdivision 6 bacterium BACL9 MAG-120924-bin69 TaxID=1655635 RepID=A0A0R2XAG1_9BACT|nr:MAG: hypothetical protein ABS33_05225 [Verrucomicrobia subdivision 6 bacterium BACL9 MAG-120924-bin69]
MRQAIVDLEFDDFGIDQDQAKIIRTKTIEEAEKESVDADRFSRASGAGNEGVGEVGQVVDQSGTVDVFAERDGEVSGGGVPLGTFDQVPQEDFDFRGVGDFDGHGVATGDGSEDVDALGFHGASEIPFQITDPLHSNARSGVKFVSGDGGPAGDVARADLNVEVGESFDNALLVGFEFILRKGGADIFLRFLEEIDRWEFVFVVGGASGGGDGGGSGFWGGFRFGGGVGRKSGQGRAWDS